MRPHTNGFPPTGPYPFCKYGTHPAGRTGVPRSHTLPQALHLALLFLTLGRCGFLPPKTGLHDGALAAALPCTVSSERARRLLSYGTHDGHVTREAALTSARAPFTPLVDGGMVRRAIAAACARHAA